jgi:3-oxoacyl-[acyl-carrier-protein] synthase-3
MRSGIGILGVGMYVPPDVRGNDWWPAELVERWREQRRTAPRGAPPAVSTDGGRLVLAALAGQAEDPFGGARQRHVMAAEQSVFEMEERAARDALDRAGVAPAEIDVLLTYTVVPDKLLSNPACILHRRLGLAEKCFSVQIDAATYAFSAQLELAEALVASGRARRALLVQSCAATRLVDKNDPVSAVFGDGATAVVVGRVADGRGLVSSVHYTDGRYPDSLVASPRGRSWYEEGRSTIHIADPAQMQTVLLATVDVIKQSVDAALADAGLTARDVSFVCMHQGTPWLRELVQKYTGLEHARSVETFTRFGYLFAAILPAGLLCAQAEGLLSPGDVVILCGGGTGMTYGATVMRWCR